jgi:hypothetical protein
MSRTRRNVPGWTTAKAPDDEFWDGVADAERVIRDYERGHPGRHDLKDNPKKRNVKWKIVNGTCGRREAKRYLKAKRNRAQRRHW